MRFDKLIEYRSFIQLIFFYFFFRNSLAASNGALRDDMDMDMIPKKRGLQLCLSLWF